MSSRKIVFLVLVLLGTACSWSIAGSRRPPETWSYYHFDGTAFQSGPGTGETPFVALKERMRPVVLTSSGTPVDSVPLPDDSGVIAGVCYYQSSGGKLAPGSGYVPCQRAALLVSSEGKQFVTVQTDDQGYFVAVLPVGHYRIGSGLMSDEIPVNAGITTLVPLRAGKRMVD